MLSRLQVDFSHGLGDAEARVRLARYGPNALPEPERCSPLAILLGQFNSLPVWLLGASALLSAATGGLADAAVILGVVMINAGIGYATESQAEGIISALTTVARPPVPVVREGRVRQTPTAEVVPGDMLLLTPGCLVAADARLVSVKDLTVDESALTGESLPVSKSVPALAAADVPLADRSNMVYMGTLVTGGSGLAVVVATGRDTELGLIQALVGETRPPETPMQRQLTYLSPDGKAQVGVEYRAGRPARIHSLTLVAGQHRGHAVTAERLRDDLMALVVEPAFQDEPIRPDRGTAIYVNPEGPLIDGGPAVHSGLTGRKNAIDSYGEYSRQSESALSGKDPTRIDRVGAYAARHAAKNVVAAGLASACEVQLTFSPGQSRPVSVQVDTFGTGRMPDEALIERIRACFDFRPAGIIRAFGLRHLPAIHRGGFYRRLAAYGQVGRMDLALPWERTDQAARLRE